jgi:hypothetical protein
MDMFIPDGLTLFCGHRNMADWALMPDCAWAANSAWQNFWIYD